MMGKCFSGLSGLYPTPPALQKFDFARRLHIAQAFACGRQGKTSLGRAVSDAPGIHYSQKQAKIGQIKPHEVIIAD